MTITPQSASPVQSILSHTNSLLRQPTIMINLDISDTAEDGARLGPCKTGLSPTVILFTDRSKAILLLWFYLFYVLESNFVLFEHYVRFHSFS